MREDKAVYMMRNLLKKFETGKKKKLHSWSSKWNRTRCRKVYPRSYHLCDKGIYIYTQIFEKNAYSGRIQVTGGKLDVDRMKGDSLLTIELLSFVPGSYYIS